MPEHAEATRAAFAEREDRILDAAAALVQRWGYRKTTIEDVARAAGVGKGTIYLHWKTREDLFIALLLRERLRAATRAEAQLAADPEGPSLHAAVKQFSLALLNSPLLRAAIERDTAIWSDMLRTQFVQTDTAQRLAAGRRGLVQLRARGQVRADESVEDQAFMLGAVTTGFMVVNSYLPPEEQLPADIMVNLLAEVVRRTFEVVPTETSAQCAAEAQEVPPDRTESSSTSSTEISSVFADLFEQARDLSRKPVE
jgi:AcrR family transcriptional regulator